MRSTGCGRPPPLSASGSTYNALISLSSSHKKASLKNHGADNDVNEMFEMGAETMELPMDEKMQFEQGDEGVSFGSVWPLWRLCSMDLPRFIIPQL